MTSVCSDAPDDNDSMLALDDGADFDVELECGPDLNNWTDGQPAAKDLK